MQHGAIRCFSGNNRGPVPRPPAPPLQLPQQICKIKLDFQTIRLEVQRPSIVGLGCIQLPQVVKDNSKIIESRQKIWLDLNSYLVTIATFSQCSPINQDRAQRVPSVSTIGVTLNRKPGGSFGLVQLPTSMKHFGMITMTLCRRFWLSACQRHEPQRHLKVFAVIGSDSELVQDEGGGGFGTRRVVLVHLHVHPSRHKTSCLRSL